jgi:hypothetical protein
MSRIIVVDTSTTANGAALDRHNRGLLDELASQSSGRVQVVDSADPDVLERFYQTSACCLVIFDDLASRQQVVEDLRRYDSQIGERIATGVVLFASPARSIDLVKSFLGR